MVWIFVKIPLSFDPVVKRLDNGLQNRLDGFNSHPGLLNLFGILFPFSFPDKLFSFN